MLCLCVGCAVPLGVRGATLTSDPMDAATTYAGVRVDGVEDPACNATAPCIADNGSGPVIWYDVSRFLGAGMKTYEARACNEFGCSDWSVPASISIAVPGVPRGLTIIINIAP